MHTKNKVVKPKRLPPLPNHGCEEKEEIQIS